MASKRPNIHKSVVAICRKLDLVPTNVSELVIAPTSVRARVYKLNEDGHKYIDLEKGKPASELRRFEVQA